MIRTVSHLSLILTFYLFQHAVTQKCHTSTDNDGICLPIRDCNSIVQQLVQGSISDMFKQEIRELQCEYLNGSPYVCCDLHTLYPYRAVVERFRNLNVQRSAKLGNLFPTSDSCGGDLSSAVYRIHHVGMQEHTGMALLKYENGRIGCGGTLINQRYVLTAASCVVGESVQLFGILKSVRLGEHDLETEPECDYSDSCRHYIEVEVAEIVISREFIVIAQHDLALIRLVDDVDTTKYQPLCLAQPINYNKSDLRVVGWGMTSNGHSLTERKYVTMDYVNKTECYDMLEKQRTTNSHLPTHIICTMPQALRKESACPLDGGGILMGRTTNYQWTIVGLASHRPSCGDGKLMPAIFTDVSHNLDWIQFNMRP